MRPILRRFATLLLLVPGSVACGSDDEFTADVAGSYTIAITNGASTCPFQDWTEGKETSGIGFTITQQGRDLHATLDGLTGAFFKLAFGSADFDGSIKGSDITLTNYGSRSQQMGNCSYTYNATVTGTQTGDSIAGDIVYATATNGNPDCSAVECSASQRFSGSRPPK